MRVLISGAGVAGPTLAWFLTKARAHVTVVEKAPTLLPHGQNIDINHSAVTVAKKMGLMDQIRELNTTEKGTQFIDTKGRPFAPFPVKQGSTASFTSEFEILRGDLSKVLYDATKNHGNIEYLFNTTIKNVISNDEKSVKVELSNGEVQEFDLLVAADGQWSRVRKQCFPAESIIVRDMNMYAVYWTMKRLPTDNDWWNVYFALGSRIITTRPDPHGTIRAMFTYMPCNAAQKKAWEEASRNGRKAQQELLRREFADAGWQAQRLLDSMDEGPDFYFQSIKQIRMSQWSTSRVVCLGDAAYCPTPLTGAGASLALIGAYVLGGELSKLEAGEHPSKALKAYETAFRPFVEDIQKIPSIIPGVAHPETAFKRWLGYVVLRTLSRVAAIPWVANKSGTVEDEDFPLPEYPKFEEVLPTTTIVN